MQNANRIKKIENLHILFWLLKDTCWMLELKWLGTAMMAPTLLLALYFTFKTVDRAEAYLNAAVFFWILANSFWMMMEFFNNSVYKDFAVIPFGLGFMMVGLFFWQNYRQQKMTGTQ